ncbi:MAG: recombination mediator RecR [Rickettsiales bacterium]
MSNRLEYLIHYISRLPSVGNKTAKRYAIHLLNHKEKVMLPLAKAIEDAATGLHQCKNCGNYDDQEICYICSDEKREATMLCIVENISDLWSLEEANVFNGKYQVLGGNLSTSTNYDTESLNMNHLLKRIKDENIQEVVIATSTSVDGQTTAFYIMDHLKDIGVKVTRLASGIPIGGELNYLDEGTIAAAFNSRKDFS